MKPNTEPNINEFYNSIENRKLMKRRYAGAFLDARRLKFPVLNENGSFNCELILRAYARAGLWVNKGSQIKNRIYYSDIQRKAQGLMEKHCNED